MKYIRIINFIAPTGLPLLFNKSNTLLCLSGLHRVRHLGWLTTVLKDSVNWIKCVAFNCVSLKCVAFNCAFTIGNYFALALVIILLQFFTLEVNTYFTPFLSTILPLGLVECDNSSTNYESLREPVVYRSGYYNKVVDLEEYKRLYNEYRSYRIFNCDPSLPITFINILGVTFEYNLNTNVYALTDRNYNAVELNIIIDHLFEDLHSINKRGYVTDNSIFRGFMIEIAAHMNQLGFENKLLGNDETLYTMWYNLMFVNLYLLLVRKLKSYKEDGFVEIEVLNIEGYNVGLENDSVLDLINELEDQKTLLLSRFDQYLKLQVQKRGLTIIQNTYTGFDTEFESLDPTKNLNKLISVQTAIQRRTIIKVPLYNSYDISYVHPLTSEISNVYNSKVDLVDGHKYSFLMGYLPTKDDPTYLPWKELELINCSIKVAISNIRKCLYQEIDDLNTTLIKTFKEVKGVEYYEDEKRDHIIFIFPLSSIATNIVYPHQGFTMVDLLNMGKEFNDKKEFTNLFTTDGEFNTDCETPSLSTISYNESKGSVDNKGSDNNFYEFEESNLDLTLGFNDKVEPTFGNKLREDFVALLKLFSQFNLTTKPLRLLQWFDNSNKKAQCRTKLYFDNGCDISLTIVKNTYLLAHYSAADLSMLEDFEELKKKLSIVNKSYVTLGKPLKVSNTNVYIRDTILLAPAGMGSLEKIGKLYESEGDFTKRSISKEDINKMSQFLERDKAAFEEYALQDAVITLKHGLAMEKFNLSIKHLGIPITLSSVGRKYVFEEWSKNFKKHLPYQISGEYLMGNVNEIITPKGLFASGDVGAHLSYFIANYKGGRNESFMYGSENRTHWFDYDLVSAYTTGMADINLPDYYNPIIIKEFGELKLGNVDKYAQGYLIVNTNFEFPKSVKYPSIPCYIDKTTTVYPMKGEAFLTWAEYNLALRQGCEFDIKSAFFIPERTKTNHHTNKITSIKPFHAIIKNIQSMRRKYKKGHINNLLYKEMGNSIYGNVVRGMSDKKSFDALTGKTFRVTGTDLSNPILASWTTAFIRSVIGECLHNIQKLGGQIVSVTTDGFITNIEDLEDKLLNLPHNDTILLRKYRNIRDDLSGNREALEIKSDGKGIISWTTRGQLGIGGKMVAATGFQRLGFEREELVTLFKKALKSSDKLFEFTRKSLRSAKDIFNKGGHVNAILKDQTFRLFYDNRREIIEPEWFDKFDYYDLSDKLLDSKPLRDIYHCKTLRFISKFPITLPFNRTNTNRAKTVYKSKLEVGVRNFIKAYYSTNEKFGLKGNEFRFAKDLVAFIKGNPATRAIKISTQSISHLKKRKLIWKPVPATDENILFCNYIKKYYPYFNDELFLKKEY